MSTGVIITLIICGTILAVVILALLFAGWVINKGAAMAESTKR